MRRRQLISPVSPSLQRSMTASLSNDHYNEIVHTFVSEVISAYELKWVACCGDGCRKGASWDGIMRGSVGKIVLWLRLLVLTFIHCGVACNRDVDHTESVPERLLLEIERLLLEIERLLLEIG